jgi:hypothetical protein
LFILYDVGFLHLTPEFSRVAIGRVGWNELLELS